MKKLQPDKVSDFKLIFKTHITFYLFCVTTAYLVDDNPYRQFVTLDSNGKYKLEWLVDWSHKRVVFNVSVQTTGYIGFGLIRRAGKMTGADLVIGGVYPNGKSFFSDRHAVANQLPEIDPSQDWKLHMAWERGGETFMSFSRPLDTCDTDHDLPITNDAITLIWAYGEIDDQIQYHSQNRGTYDVYLLDPDLTPALVDPKLAQQISSTINVFKMKTEIILPPQDTMYWCSFHRAPTNTKHHIIGFNTIFSTEVDKSHVHHLLLHRCHAPEGVDPSFLFEDAARSTGSECYFPAEPNPLPTQYCRETIHAWAVGGRAIFFPDHVGLIMSEFGIEYFLLQVHYDNHNSIPNMKISVELNAYFTENLRGNEVGMLQLGEQIPGSTSIVIPPSSLDHVIFGHCAPGCVEQIIPDGGVSIFAAFLHTHESGRKVRFLHHRGNQELSWISYDDNYNFKYQQFRTLRQERRLFPGDHLMNRCVYDTTNRNDSVVVGGFSSKEEMCTAFLYYYPKSPGFSLCRSEIRTESYWNLLGIQNATWDAARRQNVITAPSQYSGISVGDYANAFVEWDVEKRDALQVHHKYDPQVSQCPRIDIPPQDLVSSPDFQPQRYSINRNRRFQYSPLRSNQANINEASMEYLSVIPRGISRYRLSAQCSKKVINFVSTKPDKPLIK